MNALKKLLAQAGQLPKKTLFLLLLAVTAILSMMVSSVVHVIIDRQTAAYPIKLAVIAPLTGPDEKIGLSIQQGAKLYAQEYNQQRKLGEHPIEIMVFDEAANPGQEETLIRRAAGEGALAVIGHGSDTVAQRVEAVYQAEHLPALTLAAAAEQRYPDQPWLFRTSFDTSFETRFLANYVRNVIGEKAVNIVYPATPEGERLAALYDETMQRFGTKVLFKWGYEAGGMALGPRIADIAKEIGDQKLIGYLLVLGDAKDSAEIIAGLKSGGVKNRFIGLRALATQAFLSHLERAWQGEASLSSVLNSVLLTTPLLFDMAGESAQQVRGSYVAAYGDIPDWVATQAYDAARVVGQSIKNLGFNGQVPVADIRGRLRDRLAEMDRTELALPGVNGPAVLNPKRGSMPPTLIGVYDGSNLISALTQLTPIDSEAIVNYLEEVVEGRALYVNDRFMYKTNVVYTGVKINEIAKLDLNSNSAEIEFWLWFRWRGKVEPQDVVFTNTADKIVLQKPEKEGQDGDMRYRIYRVRGKFNLNYTHSERAYGNELVGIAFHHRELGRSNMMYVTDVLGMNLANRKSLTDNYKKVGLKLANGPADEGKDQKLLSKAMSWLGMTDANGNDPLTSLLKQDKVLTPLDGWAIENAWISQETVRRIALGDPLFVGFGKQQPSFSKIDQGILLKPDTVRLRDFIPSTAFLYLAVFGFMLALLAEMLDHQATHGQVWRVQVLGLRIVSWPLLLVSLGNILLDYSLGHWPAQTTKTVELVYAILWWLIPARLLSILVKQFLWDPLEQRAKRKVPDSVKSLTSFMIYLFATFGITAFVFNQAVTSLLATTGATAMIIGLAVKANIDNVFSGIVLNLERPFNIGDLVSYNKISGKIADITWRTTHITSDNGSLVIVPNSRISAGEINNFSRAPYFKSAVSVFVAPHHDPQKILSLIESCVPDNPHFLPAKPGQEPKVFYRGLQYDTSWTARYEVTIYTRDHKDQLKKAAQHLWLKLGQAFDAEGVVFEYETPREVSSSSNPELALEGQDA